MKNVKHTQLVSCNSHRNQCSVWGCMCNFVVMLYCRLILNKGKTWNFHCGDCGDDCFEMRWCVMWYKFKIFRGNYCPHLLCNSVAQNIKHQAHHDIPRPRRRQTVISKLQQIEHVTWVVDIRYAYGIFVRKPEGITGCVKALLLFQLRTAALKLIVRSWLDVPTFATRRLHACHHAREPSGGRWNFGREMSSNFA